MELKRLNTDELTRLYQEEMVEDFPQAELKPLSGGKPMADIAL